MRPVGCHPADTPLAHALAKGFAALSLDDSLARLQAAGVPCAPAVSGHSELFLDDPHAAANDMVATYQHPFWGSSASLGTISGSATPRSKQGRPTPLLGEHTREVLMDVGFSESAIAELYAKGRGED